MKAQIDRRADVFQWCFFFSNANPKREELIFKKTSKNVCACVVGFVGGQEMGCIFTNKRKTDSSRLLLRLSTKWAHVVYTMRLQYNPSLASERTLCAVKTHDDYIHRWATWHISCPLVVGFSSQQAIISTNQINLYQRWLLSYLVYITLVYVQFFIFLISSSCSNN